MNLQTDPIQRGTLRMADKFQSQIQTQSSFALPETPEMVFSFSAGNLLKRRAVDHNSLATFPDFPAEIRAPIGTTYGVSAFQIKFGSRMIKTSGDSPDVLVALNPAALKVNYKDVRVGGLIVLDAGSFTERNLKKAGFEVDPRGDGTLGEYRTIEIDISALTLEATKPFDVTQKEALRGKKHVDARAHLLDVRPNDSRDREVCCWKVRR